MTKILLYIAILLLAYLMGCSNMALYLSRYKGVDLRAAGSKNLGASNAMVLMGWGPGVIVAVHDIGKALLAVVLARHFGQGLPFIAAAAGVACVLGHMFPFFLRFRGGKGFATFVGMTLGMHWQFFLGLVIVVALITLFSGYIVFGTLLSITAYPVYVFFMDGAWIPMMIIAVASLAMLYRHRENFKRLREMKEMKLDLFHRK